MTRSSKKTAEGSYRQRRSTKLPPSRAFFLAMLLALPFVQGSSCDINTPGVTAAVERVTDSMNNAIAVIDSQSSQWQNTLTNLESQLAADAKDLEGQIFQDINQLINKVDYVVKDGIQFGQESINCQIDIFRTHAKIALQNLLNDFLDKYGYKGIKNRPEIAYIPIVCSANPTTVNVGQWDSNATLALSGVDFNLFDTQAPSVIVVRSDGSQVEAKNMGSRTSNYRYQINVQTMIMQGFLKNAVQLQVRWNGQSVNRNEIPVTDCGHLNGPCCKGDLCDSGTCVSQACVPCGKLNEHCCNHTLCTTGACVGDMCTACGAVGQPCCSGNACSGGTCKNGKCNTVMPPCAWTADFSEEAPGQMACPSGFAVRGVKCKGSNCDNMSLYCCPYMDHSDSSATTSFSGEFSEEGSGAPYSAANATKFVSGMKCRGSYCDNIKLQLLSTPHLQFQGQCVQGEWFSEEGTNHRECPADQWVGGMACREDYCDDISLYCCRGEIRP